MKKISPWVDGDGYAYRYVLYTDPEVVANRVAFIEKTPRVRIRRHWNDNQYPDWLNWCEGPGGEGPKDEESRAWCDKMLAALYPEAM